MTALRKLQTKIFKVSIFLFFSGSLLKQITINQNYFVDNLNSILVKENVLKFQLGVIMILQKVM